MIIAIIGIALNVKAQTHSFGIQGGLNFTNISAKDFFSDTEYRISLIGGLKYEVFFSDKYLIGVDMLYSQQGFVDRIVFTDIHGNQTGENADTKFNYDYFVLPVKFGYTIGTKFKITPKIGIQPAFLINAKTFLPKFDSNGNEFGEEVVDVKENVSKFDLSGLLELELGYGLKPNFDIFTSVSGKYGMTTFSNNDYFKQNKLRHNSITLSVGVKYKIAKN